MLNLIPEVYAAVTVTSYCSDQKAKQEIDGIDTENLAVLERLKQNQRDDYLKVSMGESFQD